jgi:hypothetical protein
MERLLIIIILSLFITNCFAQDSLDFGKIKHDTAFDCAKSKTLESAFGINSICNSKNQFELRLTMYNRPGGGSGLIILTYNNKKWDVKKYQNTRGALGYKLTSTYYESNYDRVHEYIFKLVFDTLKNNNAFTLPNQEDLNLKGNIFDGAAYKLTFKANNNFRSYWFENPETYLEDNPEVIELKKYSAIVKILNSLF